MASMRKKGKGGYYYARFYDRHRSPQRKEVPLRTTRKDVARRRLTKLERRYEQDEYDPWAPDTEPEHITVSAVIGRYLEAKDHLRASTLADYETTLRAWHRDYVPAGLTLRLLQPTHIVPYVHAPDVQQATRRRRYRYLRALLNWCLDSGLLDTSPLDDVRQPRREQKQQAFLSTADVEKLLLAIDAHAAMRDGKAGRQPDDAWLRAMIHVAVCTGLRRGELLRLRWQDVDLDSGLLYVRNRGGARTKSGNERAVPLAGDAVDVLQRLKAERADEEDGPVFVDSDGLPPRPDRVTHRFKFYVRKAKLRDRKRLKFHSLRHTTGSWLAMKGVPMRVIQGILGHSSVQVTEQYSHLAPEVAVKAMQETFGE